MVTFKFYQHLGAREVLPRNWEIKGIRLHSAS